MDGSVSLGMDPPRALLVVAGDFDAEATPELKDELDVALAEGCTYFEVDASAVTFVDVSGLRLLIWLRDSVEPLGGEVAVCAASERFRWAATVIGLGDAVGLDRLPDPEDGSSTP